MLLTKRQIFFYSKSLKKKKAQLAFEELVGEVALDPENSSVIVSTKEGKVIFF